MRLHGFFLSFLSFVYHCYRNCVLYFSAASSTPSSPFIITRGTVSCTSPLPLPHLPLLVLLFQELCLVPLRCFSLISFFFSISLLLELDFMLLQCFFLIFVKALLPYRHCRDCVMSFFGTFYIRYIQLFLFIWSSLALHVFYFFVASSSPSWTSSCVSSLQKLGHVLLGYYSVIFTKLFYCFVNIVYLVLHSSSSSCNVFITSSL